MKLINLKLLFIGLSCLTVREIVIYADLDYPGISGLFSSSVASWEPDGLGGALEFDKAERAETLSNYIQETIAFLLLFVGFVSISHSILLQLAMQRTQILPMLDYFWYFGAFISLLSAFFEISSAQSKANLQHADRLLDSGLETVMGAGQALADTCSQTTTIRPAPRPGSDSVSNDNRIERAFWVEFRNDVCNAYVIANQLSSKSRLLALHGYSPDFEATTELQYWGGTRDPEGMLEFRKTFLKDQGAYRRIDQDLVLEGCRQLPYIVKLIRETGVMDAVDGQLLTMPGELGSPKMSAPRTRTNNRKIVAEPHPSLALAPISSDTDSLRLNVHQISDSVPILVFLKGSRVTPWLRDFANICRAFYFSNVQADQYVRMVRVSVYNPFPDVLRGSWVLILSFVLAVRLTKTTAEFLNARKRDMSARSVG